VHEIPEGFGLCEPRVAFKCEKKDGNTKNYGIRMLQLNLFI